MPYARPTLAALFNSVIQDINSADIGADALLRKAVLRVLARVFSGLAYLHYDYQDWIARQAVPWTATDEYLAGWAALRGIFREDATPASFSATFSGTIGAGIPTLTSVVRGDGATFTSQAGAVVGSGGTATIALLADQPGAVGNSDPGTQLSMTFPVPAILGSSGIAGAVITTGTDIEPEINFRARVLLAFASQPAGGDRADYVGWALAVPGVTRAWVIPNGQGPGTIVLYVMLDEAEAANGGFPQGGNGVSALDPRDTVATGDLLTVANALIPKQPVTALVYVCAPVPLPVAFTIANLGTANTAAMQTAIQAALAAVFLAASQVGGAINLATGKTFAPIDTSLFYAALLAIPTLTQFTISTIPAAPVTPGPGQLPTLGTITYSS